MKKVKNFTSFLHIFIGVGACGGGLGAVIHPINPMGMPMEALEHSPFTTFLVPGLFLLIVLGIGNILSFLISKYFNEASGYLSGIMGIILMLWIVLQCIFLHDVVSLHVIFFILGLVQCILAAGIIYVLNQWPADDVTFFVYRLQDRIKKRKTRRY